MRLRTSIFLAFVALSMLQVLAVVPFALQSLNALLSQQQSTRIAGVMDSIGAAWARVLADTQHSVEELAHSEALERVARDARLNPPPSHLAQAAQGLMIPRGLTVLSLFDEQGRTLSSGHLPARLGDVDQTLFATTRAGKTPVPVMVELPGQAGLIRRPALVTARPVEYGDKRIWVVGGVLVDQSLAQFLANLANAQVEVLSGEEVVAAAGLAAGPYTQRALALSPVGEIRFRFGRSDLLATQRQVLRAFALLFAIGLGLSILAAVWIARRITRPVEALTEAASRIAAGALDARVEEKASGEVGALVRAFNQMGQDLTTTTEQLVASERVAAWQEVARRLAHELKNPLTPIKMSLETLMAASDSDHPRFKEFFRESAGAVLEEVDRLKRIVDEFSRFARLPKPELSPLELSELATQVRTLYAAPREGITLRSELTAGAHVMADRDQLTQVLVNLVKNAEEAMPRGGTITLRVKVGEAFASVEVEDQGPGIKPEDRYRVFEPYFTTKEGGTGLGLAIAARICQEHGGRLEVGGEAGRGAVFAVVLPRSVAAPLSAGGQAP